jgi:hypothetical protein
MPEAGRFERHLLRQPRCHLPSVVGGTKFASSKLDYCHALDAKNISKSYTLYCPLWENFSLFEHTVCECATLNIEWKIQTF